MESTGDNQFVIVADVGACLLEKCLKSRGIYSVIATAVSTLLSYVVGTVLGAIVGNIFKY